jgi:hypothetical protein
MTCTELWLGGKVDFFERTPDAALCNDSAAWTYLNNHAIALVPLHANRHTQHEQPLPIRKHHESMQWRAKAIGSVWIFQDCKPRHLAI